MLRNAGAIILKMAYGYNVTDEEDGLVELVDQAVQGFNAASVPGAFLVDSFPACMLYHNLMVHNSLVSCSTMAPRLASRHGMEGKCSELAQEIRRYEQCSFSNGKE